VLYLLGCSVDFLLPLLSAPTETEDKVKGGLLLDVVVRERATVLQLLASKNEALLVRRDPFLVCVSGLVNVVLCWYSTHTLDLRFYIVDGVRRLNLKGNRLSREGLYEDLHDSLWWRQPC